MIEYRLLRKGDLIRCLGSDCEYWLVTSSEPATIDQRRPCVCVTTSGTFGASVGMVSDAGPDFAISRIVATDVPDFVTAQAIVALKRDG